MLFVNSGHLFKARLTKLIRQRNVNKEHLLSPSIACSFWLGSEQGLVVDWVDEAASRSVVLDVGDSDCACRLALVMSTGCLRSLDGVNSSWPFELALLYILFELLLSKNHEK